MQQGPRWSVTTGRYISRPSIYITLEVVARCHRPGLIALAIVIVAVIPGSMYTWAYEREASAFGVTLADRTLRFIAISLLFHLALGWPEYTLYRVALAGPHFEVGQFAAIWIAVLLVVAMPVFIGTVLGGLYATRNSREDWDVIRSRLSPERERRLLRLALGRTPAPRAWDDLFSDRPTMYLRGPDHGRDARRWAVRERLLRRRFPARRRSFPRRRLGPCR